MFTVTVEVTPVFVSFDLNGLKTKEDGTSPPQQNKERAIEEGRGQSIYYLLLHYRIFSAALFSVETHPPPQV
jgi:hypothetical protein